jgi:hypothetical protein
VREDLIEDLYIRAENEARKAVIAQQSKTKRKVRHADEELGMDLGCIGQKPSDFRASTSL